jgi:hypothetical protein
VAVPNPKLVDWETGTEVAELPNPNGMAVDVELAGAVPNWKDPVGVPAGTVNAEVGIAVVAALR